MQQLFRDSNDQWEWVLWEPFHQDAPGTQQTCRPVYQNRPHLAVASTQPQGVLKFILPGLPPTLGMRCFRSPTPAKFNKPRSVCELQDGRWVTHKMALQTNSRLISSINKWPRGSRWKQSISILQTLFARLGKNKLLSLCFRAHRRLWVGPPHCSSGSILQSQ